MKKVTKRTKDAMIRNFVSLQRKYGLILDKYVPSPKEAGETEYFFTFQSDGSMVNIDKIFCPVYHGPARKTAN